MPQYGFNNRPRGRTFSRSMPFGRWAFNLGVVSARQAIDDRADVALRVAAVEDLVARDNHPLSARDRRQTFTMGAELGNIARGIAKWWTILAPENVEPVASEILRDFETVGLPYLERFSDLEAMLDVLRRNDASGWLHSPIHAERCKRAVALAFVLGKQAIAERHAAECTQFLEARNDPGMRRFQHFIGAVIGGTAR